MEKSIIDEINNLTNNDYKFVLKSAILNKTADFCVVEIFYKDGILLEKTTKEMLEKKMLEIFPKKYQYEIKFVKNYASDEQIIESTKKFIEDSFSSICFEIKTIERKDFAFSIVIFVDEMSFEYAEKKQLANCTKNYLKKLFDDYDFQVKIECEKVFKIDKKREFIENYKEEIVNEADFRKIDIFDIVPLVNSEIVPPATYIVDKKSSEEDVTICGKIKSIKKIIKVCKRKSKSENSDENVENTTENNVENLENNKITENNVEKNDKSLENVENSNKMTENVESDGVDQTEKTFEKVFFKWDLEDFTGQIGCVFFANKENVSKVEKLTEGSVVAVHGKVEKNNFGALNFRVHDIAYCSVPENLEEFVIYKKEKPFYEFVEPEKITIYRQDNLLNFLDDNAVPKYLQNKTFVCYDLETTGLHYERGDRMVEIGAVKIIDGKIVEKFVSFVNPNGKKIDPEASKTTGIFDDDVKDAPMDFEVLQDFYKFSKDAILIGYNNINFDNRFLFGQARECRWNFDNKTEDVFKFAQKYVTGVKNYKLGTVAEKLGVVLDNAHSAVFDALATAEVFLKIAQNIEC